MHNGVTAGCVHSRKKEDGRERYFNSGEAVFKQSFKTNLFLFLLKEYLSSDRTLFLSMQCGNLKGIFKYQTCL